MKKCTMVDIAEHCGFSQTTVSLVLSGKENIGIPHTTREKILNAARELGYKPGKTSLATKLIGLMVSNLTNPYFSMITSFVEMYAHVHGYNTIICNTKRMVENERVYLDDLLNRGVEGIIIAFTPENSDYIIKLSKKIPIIIIGETDNNSELQTIGLSSAKAGELVAEHLYELGHRKIAYFSSPLSNVSLSRFRRLEGMKTFLKSKGIMDTFYVLEGVDESESDEIYEIELGYNLTKKLLSNYDVTAIVAVSDLLAPGIYKTLEQAGLRVPQDISVVGFDNNFLSKVLVPKLTSVDHYIKERSKFAIDQMVYRINNNKGVSEFSYSVEYRPVLVARESTAIEKSSRK